MKLAPILAPDLSGQPMFLAGRIARENAWGTIRDTLQDRDREAFDAGWLDASNEIAERRWKRPA